MSSNLQLAPEERALLERLLSEYLPGVKVWAYGSRVKGTARPNSDLDLVVFAEESQRWAVAELRDALAESDLPFKVDLHIWEDLPEPFHRQIETEYVEVVGAGANRTE